MSEKKVSVKVIKRYNDIVLKEIQEIGNILTVSDARAKHLIKEGMAELVKDIPAKPEKQEGKEQ